MIGENSPEAGCVGTDTFVQGNGLRGIRSRGSGTTVTLANRARSRQNGHGVLTDLYGKVLFATSGQSFTVENNNDGLWSETASEVNSQNASHRIINNSPGVYDYDVLGMDFSTTDVDQNYWGPNVTSFANLSVGNGDALIIIDPVLTSDPAGASPSGPPRRAATSRRFGHYPSGRTSPP